MEIKPYPGYELHINFPKLMDAADDAEKARLGSIMGGYLSNYTLPEGMTMEDIQIPGAEEGLKITLRIYRPANLGEKPPVIMEVHGGGWVGGNLDIDNRRCIFLAEHTPCVVIGVDYRLASPEVHFPKPLEDVLTAWKYIYAHADELGVDKDRMGLHGTSAGANLIAGLSLYIRDHGLNAPALTALNCPVLTDHQLGSAIRLGFGPGCGGNCYTTEVDRLFYPATGQQPSYYAYPLYCHDLSFLNPHCIITGEYDALRDHGIQYATRLLDAGVPCELVVAPRVDHGFCVVDEPFSDYIQMGVCYSFQREFGLMGDRKKY